MRKLRSTFRKSRLSQPGKAATILAMAAFGILIRPTDPAQADRTSARVMDLPERLFRERPEGDEYRSS